MSEITRKPLEAMSQWERDRYYGEWGDFGDERKAWAADIAEEELIEGIFHIVQEIMQFHNMQGTLQYAQILICNTQNKHAAYLVAKYFYLELIHHPFMPLSHYVVCERSKIERTINSLVAEELAKNVNKLIIPSGVKRK